MLQHLYECPDSEGKMGGLGVLIEVDETLLGKKPTYNHGKINKIFKMWVVGIKERRRENAIPNTVFRVV